ncbi:MAG: reverse transcriptase family protein, partial [Bacteroidota bacterium]
MYWSEPEATIIDESAYPSWNEEEEKEEVPASTTSEVQPVVVGAVAKIYSEGEAFSISMNALGMSRTMVALVDTGSPATFISSTCCPREWLQNLHNSNSLYQTCNGKSLQVLGQLEAEIFLCGPAKTQQVEVLQEIAEYDAILGRDFLEDFLIDLGEGAVYHKLTHDQQLAIGRSTEELHISSKTKLPAKSVSLVFAHLPKGARKKTLIFPKELEHGNRKLVVASTVSVASTGQVSLLIANTGEEEVTLRQDAKVATAELVNSDKIAWEDVDKTTPATGPHEDEPDLPLQEVLEKLATLGVEFNPETTSDQLLKNNEFFHEVANSIWRQRDVFTKEKIPDENRFPPFRFSLLENAKPIRQSPYRTTPLKQQAIDTYVKNMVESGIAVPSISPWASPLIVVLQPDGSGGVKKRVCVDLRRVNAACLPDGGSQALPLINELLDSVQDATLFSTLDHASGYTQWAVEEEHRGLTAFVTHEGLFESTRLTFGVAAAPAAYQRAMLALMSSLFRRGLVSMRPLVYIDDNLIAGTDAKRHLADVITVLRFMRTWNLAMRQGKCAFFQHTVNYLGHTLSAGGFSPLER